MLLAVFSVTVIDYSAVIVDLAPVAAQALVVVVVVAVAVVVVVLVRLLLVIIVVIVGCLGEDQHLGRK